MDLFGGLPDGEVPILPFAFMDDLAEPVKSANAGKLLGDVEVVTSIFVHVAAAYGLHVQLGLGKSDALLVVVGEGADAVRAEIARLEADPVSAAPLLRCCRCQRAGMFAWWTRTGTWGSRSTRVVPYLRS